MPDTNDTPLERVRAFLSNARDDVAWRHTLDPRVQNLAITNADLRAVLQAADDCKDAERKGDEAIQLRQALGIELSEPSDAAVRAAKFIRENRDNQTATIREIAKTLGHPDGALLKNFAPAVHLLKTFANNAADVFKLPANYELHDLFTYVYRCRDERDGFLRTLHAIRGTLGLEERISAEDVANGVLTLKGMQQEKRRECDQAYERLAVEREARKQAQAELADLKGHCTRIEAENQRYRGSTLDAKAAHNRRLMAEWTDRAPDWARFVFADSRGNVHYSVAAPVINEFGGCWVIQDKFQTLGASARLIPYWADTLTPIPARAAAEPEGRALVEADLTGLLRLAPSWARYIAVDSNGAVWAYENELRQDATEWSVGSAGGRCSMVANLGHFVSNWQLTVRLANHARPLATWQTPDGHVCYRATGVTMHVAANDCDELAGLPLVAAEGC